MDIQRVVHVSYTVHVNLVSKINAIPVSPFMGLVAKILATFVFFLWFGLPSKISF